MTSKDEHESTEYFICRLEIMAEGAVGREQHFRNRSVKVKLARPTALIRY